jgi:hypothetical protein
VVGTALHLPALHFAAIVISEAARTGSPISVTSEKIDLILFEDAY